MTRRAVWAVLAAVAVAVAPLWWPSEPPGGTVGPPPRSTVRAAAAPLPAAVPVRVRATGVDAPLTPVGRDDAGAVDVAAGSETAGWYVGARTPGERGPAVLAAHVDWAGRSGPFAGLRALGPGDLVRVDRADGSVAVFEVQTVRRYPKSAFPTASVYGERSAPVLRLITCGGPYDRTARSYADNVIVFAALVT